MSAAEALPVVVFGTGALACAIGSRLARAGERVTLVGTWSAARETIARGGIVVHEPDGTWSARVGTAPLEEPPGPVPLALVLVKGHRTAGVAPAVSRALTPDGMAVTLQNGLGSREVLEATLGPGRVVVGVAVLGARLLGPGEVRVIPGRIVLGEEPGSVGAAQGLATRMRAANLDVETTRDVSRLIWSKLAVSCALNPLTALHGVTNGAVLEDPDLRRQLRAASREVGAVAAAKGIDLDGEPAELAEQVAEATASNRSSMLQDVERGVTTEIDVLCGAVVEEGRRLGVPTPVNDALWRGVREREGRPTARQSGAEAGPRAAAQPAAPAGGPAGTRSRT